MTKSADGILINTARFSIDNFVPIVGGFAADSLDMVISCIGLIKNAVGLIGILIIISLLAVPVIKLLSIAVIYKVIAIAAEPVATRNISDSLSEIGSAAVTMTVVLATGAFMFLIFITILMGMGGGGVDIVKQWVSSLFIMILALSFMEMLPADNHGEIHKVHIFTGHNGCHIACRAIYLTGEY